MTLEQALDRLLELGGSDLLISCGSGPRIRRDGKLELLDSAAQALTPEDTEQMAKEVLDAEGGPPMHLTATGTEQRRALVLILHDSSMHATTPEREWVPKGLCKT